MKYVHLYTGDDGESHFKDVEIEMKDTKDRGQRSEPVRAKTIFFSATDPRFEVDWHKVPGRRFVITIEGEDEVTASDGTKRRFGPGDIMLADDAESRGHISRTLSNTARKKIFVTLE